jgi:cytochrome P450
MIEASGEEGDSDEEKETTEPPAECPAHKAATTAKKAVAKGVMTDKEVYTNAAGFLVAGNETTSILLSYTSYLLALNPDIQEKLQSEIDAYLEENPVSLSL